MFKVITIISAVKKLLPLHPLLYPSIPGEVIDAIELVAKLTAVVVCVVVSEASNVVAPTTLSAADVIAVPEAAVVS